MPKPASTPSSTRSRSPIGRADEPLTMNHDRYDDGYVRSILDKVRVIAMVGASPNWNRPSYFAMKYLQGKGFRVIPVNPTAVGQDILGEKVYAGLKDIPDKVDMVDVFRAAD